MYHYRIEKIVKVVDGDTVDVIIDLGFHTTVKKRIRLHGINTPETRTRDKEEKKRGLAAKERLKELIVSEGVCEEKDKGLFLKSRGLGKYGRVLGELIKDGIILNRMLVREGHAKEYHGK
tara:strand:+ start:5778 stop:6137 length:360 start_codon:yes stop_codon:yes gene_type:complete